MSDEGNHSRRRQRHASVPGHARHLQAAAPDLQQADGLLPAGHADAGGHSRRAADHDARRRGGLQAAARGWQPHRAAVVVHRAAVARRPGAGVHPGTGFRRRRPRGVGARRQPVLRTGIHRRPATRGRPHARRHGLRLSGPRPAALRRGGVRRRRPRDQHRGETRRASVVLRGHGPVFLRQRRRSTSRRD